MDLVGGRGADSKLGVHFVQAVASELDAVCFVNDSTDNGVRIANAAFSAGDRLCVSRKRLPDEMMEASSRA